jgi:alcohol dehydrogenase (cytochrome c)
LLDGTVDGVRRHLARALWKLNVGSGFSAPPMTFEVDGKQYVAIVSGPSPGARTRLVNTPQLREQRHAVVLYVFEL